MSLAAPATSAPRADPPEARAEQEFNFDAHAFQRVRQLTRELDLPLIADAYAEFRAKHPEPGT